MSQFAAEAPASKTPWHLWVVGILSLLWNAAGAYTIITAQQGRLAGISEPEAAYYAAQAPWFVAVTDISLFSAIAGAMALLIKNRFAVPLFAISLVSIAVTNGYDLVMGTSQMFNNIGTIITTCLIWVLAVLQLWYSAAMRGRGVLR
ncbi:MAG: hypothetical protein J7493_01040 [Porphyrobacter sp.]|nr:hypothetical protein [Porphyrobacter sp.]